MPSAPAAASVLLTGATGFLGKVVLEELLRRRSEFGLDKVFVVVRKKGGKTPDERFNQIMRAKCFAGLEAAFKRHVVLVTGSLAQDRCGIDSADYDRLAAHTTHIIHCAASVDFDLPLRDACESNITASLQVLELAKQCRRLQRMVSVSTAYTTSHRDGPLVEELAPLPRPAGDILAEIHAGKASKEAMLRSTGHPNTYTLTKCIAEHVLMERRGQVPLKIVRPSIISAAWKHPFPGWIDSAAALAGFVQAIGAGFLHVVHGDFSTYLDVVPVDEVAARIFTQAFEEQDDSPSVTFAVASVEHSYSIDEWVAFLEDYYTRHPVFGRVRMNYLGPRNWVYELNRALHHQLPSKIAQAMFALQGNRGMQKRARRLVQKLDMINEVFPYFTNKTFDFRPSVGLSPGFDVDAYVPVICEGVMRHLMDQDPTRVRLGGKAAKQPKSDLLWALKQPRGNLAIRASAMVLTKAMRRMFDEVTFDQKSFEMARKLAGPDGHIVVIPTHRSYMDFLICSYLFFARPHLDLRIPYIAAAQEFSKVSMVGWLFEQMHAFYLKRGTGKADPELNDRVHELIDRGEALEFFIEGQRSRSRQFLAPRRGLLRSLQATGKKFVVLPVSVSYDRVPEEAAFLRELKGYPKDKMRLANLVHWTRRMVRGEVQLGRLHVTCGAPLPFSRDDDVHAFSHQVMQELQRGTVCTSFHVQSFAEAHVQEEVDAAWLQMAIQQRGGTVLQSSLKPPAGSLLDPTLERSLRNQWAHLFIADAAAAQPQNAALAHHSAENDYVSQATQRLPQEDPQGRLARLLHLLFEPVCADYQAVARSAKRFAGKTHALPTDQIVHHSTYMDFTTAQSALKALEARGLVQRVDSGHHLVTGRSADFAAFIDACTWRMEKVQVRHLSRLGTA